MRSACITNEAKAVFPAEEKSFYVRNSTFNTPNAVHLGEWDTPHTGSSVLRDGELPVLSNEETRVANTTHHGETNARPHANAPKRIIPPQIPKHGIGNMRGLGATRVKRTHQHERKSRRSTKRVGYLPDYLPRRLDHNKPHDVISLG